MNLILWIVLLLLVVVNIFVEVSGEAEILLELQPQQRLCTATTCPSDTYCVLQAAKCYSPPCSPKPICKLYPSETSSYCSDEWCSKGYKCILKEIRCLQPPCSQTRIPMCIPISISD